MGGEGITVPDYAPKLVRHHSKNLGGYDFESKHNSGRCDAGGVNVGFCGEFCPGQTADAGQ